MTQSTVEPLVGAESEGHELFRWTDRESAEMRHLTDARGRLRWHESEMDGVFFAFGSGGAHYVIGYAPRQPAWWVYINGREWRIPRWQRGFWTFEHAVAAVQEVERHAPTSTWTPPK